MRIEYRVGDLLASPVRVIAHGCNGKGVMASGIAKLIRERFPEAYDAYREAHEENDLFLGQVIWGGGEGKLIANCITQASYGRDKSVVYVSYDAVRACVRLMNATAQALEITEIGFPLIGAGLANGHWPTIAAIIEEEATAFQPIVYTLDGVIPT